MEDGFKQRLIKSVIVRQQVTADLYKMARYSRDFCQAVRSVHGHARKAAASSKAMRQQLFQLIDDPKEYETAAITDKSQAGGVSLGNFAIRKGTL